MDQPVHYLSAVELRARLQRRDISARELMNATYDRIDALNPRLNALVNLLQRDQALTLADAADAKIARGESGALLGLPMAPKDAEDVQGFPTTLGFVPFKDRVAKQDGLMVTRLKAAGALMIGKSNMPEFGLGSHTFNRVFGHTFNPWNVSRTPGGSSGGAAVALATGMLPIADGSDMGGSLRNPASFCNVVGLRPSIGRVPDDVNPLGWFARISTKGPMGRTVADTALLLSVQAGANSGDPLSLTGPIGSYSHALTRDLTGMRVAFSPDLGLPVDPAVRKVLAGVPDVMTSLGCHVDLTAPDFSGAMEIFNVQRAALLSVTGRAFERTLPNWREHAKDTVIWNIEQGLALTAEAIIASEVERTRLYRRIAKFFETYDALLLPAAQVPPFDAKLDWVHEVDGVPMPTYLDWMRVCCVVSVTGLPAISVPAGFTDNGLPVGVQIVGKPHGDLELLQIAQAVETATGRYLHHPSGL